MPITQSTWMETSKDIREKLIAIFQIPKSSFIWVDGGIVKSDGITDKDLQALTDEKLLDFCGAPGNSYEMFVECVRKLSEIPTNVDEISEPSVSAGKGSESYTEESKEEIIGNKITDLQCDKCEFKTKSKFALRMHVGRKHKT